LSRLFAAARGAPVRRGAARAARFGAASVAFRVALVALAGALLAPWARFGGLGVLAFTVLAGLALALRARRLEVPVVRELADPAVRARRAAGFFEAVLERMERRAGLRLAMTESFLTLTVLR
jgi:hypothetical protein